jgi:hypothetical protein
MVKVIHGRVHTPPSGAGKVIPVFLAAFLVFGLFAGCDKAEPARGAAAEVVEFKYPE